MLPALDDLCVRSNLRLSPLSATLRRSVMTFPQTWSLCSWPVGDACALVSRRSAVHSNCKVRAGGPFSFWLPPNPRSLLRVAVRDFPVLFRSAVGPGVPCARAARLPRLRQGVEGRTAVPRPDAARSRRAERSARAKLVIVAARERAAETARQCAALPSMMRPPTVLQRRRLVGKFSGKC